MNCHIVLGTTSTPKDLGCLELFDSLSSASEFIYFQGRLCWTQIVRNVHVAIANHDFNTI